jgi:hypothetical protein
MLGCGAKEEEEYYVGHCPLSEVYLICMMFWVLALLPFIVILLRWD